MTDHEKDANVKDHVRESKSFSFSMNEFQISQIISQLTAVIVVPVVAIVRYVKRHAARSVNVEMPATKEITASQTGMLTSVSFNFFRSTTTEF